ncbi:MAG: DEAD/DEAH box helicase [Candidatus Omnitrophica bacterium]|nr:DEAD/DEAH box helicase [Candidatus Omnitrophota bacterium]
MESFRSLGLSENTLKVLQRKGFEEPTPIQKKTIPAILRGEKDIVGQAQTGTGKTAAFGLPIIELLPDSSRTVGALVLTPTRELAIQVAEEIMSLKGNKRLSVVPIYGGQSIGLQLRSLQKGIDIVVGTPGRILDHLRRGTLKLDKISYLVLDEADEMLNMGFLEDVREIMKNTNAQKRTMLFSATMPNEILQIAKKHMKEYDLFKVTTGQLTISKTDQIYFEVSMADKFDALCRIIDIEDDFYGLIFCRTKVDVDTIGNRLMERGYDADALHGDMSQALRERILNKFKKRMINILVATDVAARGIDVCDLTHVINYALPQDSRSYIHRVGRTGRAGKEGNAITFITPSEYRKLQYISRDSKTDIRKAKLPKVQDVIKIKKARIKSNIEDLVKSQLPNVYHEMSKELLEKNNPEDLLAALLKYSFHSELDEKRYVEIESAVVDTKGKTRLFVTHGRDDGLTPRKLIDFIKEKCNISNDKIKDIKILDKFSFVTLPFHEAEVLLSQFKRGKKGLELYITKAKKVRK